MGKHILIITLCLYVNTTLLAQGSRVFDNRSVPSKILKMDRKYSIYLPEDYFTSERSYPVLYLLHGNGDDHTGWVQLGDVKRISDKAIEEERCTPMIIVMPDANTGQRGYFNSPKGDWNYEDFFFQEFMPYIEKTYRIRAEKHYRAIAGLSMGGGGTIVYALHHPEMFSSACPLSAGNGLHDWDTFRETYKKNYEGISDDLLLSFYKQHNGFELTNSLPVDQMKTVRWYIDCGDDDISRVESNLRFYLTMIKKGIQGEFRVRDGAHTWNCWRGALPSVLEFVSQPFCE